MRRILAVLLLLVCANICAALRSASAATMSALTTWSPNSDGWLAPAEGGYAYLPSGNVNTERGLAYGNGHVYLVSRASVGGNAVNVRILDQSTGADLGGLNTTGVSGGTFAVSAAAVGGDGAIYVANLTTQSTTSPFKVYKWATEGAVASVAYSGDAGLAGSRAGDSFAGIGSGSSTLLVAGYNSTPAVAGNNGYALIDPTASTATAVGFTGTPPNAGDFRLGITFADTSHVLGTAGSSLYRYSSFSGASGTLIGSPAIPDPAGATADRLLAYTVLGGIPMLAVQSIGDSHVSIYEVSNPGAPTYLVSGNNTSGALTANGNGTGQLAWGATTDNGNGTFSQILYAMSTNQGIQAFVVTTPEPGTLSLVALLFGLGGLALRRRL
jgi:hypothetical protein